MPRGRRNAIGFEEVVLRLGFLLILLAVLSVKVPAVRQAVGELLGLVVLVAVIVGVGLAAAIVARAMIRRRQSQEQAWVEARQNLAELQKRAALEKANGGPLPSAKVSAPRSVRRIDVAGPAPFPAIVAPPPPSLSTRLRDIDWFQFEKLVAAVYQARGFMVVRQGGAHPDGGVDLLAEKDGETTVVQCKHWQSYLVRPDKVREVIGSRTIAKADRAAIVTLRGFSDEARRTAREQRVELVEEAGLVMWLEELRFSPVWHQIESALDASAKTCPRCEARLIERTATKGGNAGGKFWGCTAYPRCRYILR